VAIVVAIKPDKRSRAKMSVVKIRREGVLWVMRIGLDGLVRVV
jgi:hypothetical protein